MLCFLALVLVSLWEAVVISGAFLPSLTGRFVQWEQAESTDAALRKTVFVGMAAVLSAIIFGITLAVFGGFLGRMIGPGLNDVSLELFSGMVRLLAPAPAFATLAITVAAVNRLHGGELSFAVTALIINGLSLPVLIISPWFVESPVLVAKIYASSISGAAFVACGHQLWALRGDLRSGLFSHLVDFVSHETRRWSKMRLTMTEFAPLWLPLILAVAAQEAYSVIDLAIASTTAEGGVAAYGYADRLTKIVVAIIGGAVFVVLDPRWSRFVSEADARRETIGSDMRDVLLLVMPFYATLLVVADDIAEVAYGYGAINVAEIETIGAIARLLAIGGPCVVVGLMCARLLVFSGNAKAILFINLALIPAKVLISWLLVLALGLRGLAISSVLISVSQIVFLSWTLCRTEFRSLLSNGLFSVSNLAAIIGVFLSCWVAAEALNGALPMWRSAFVFIAGSVTASFFYRFAAGRGAGC